MTRSKLLSSLDWERIILVPILVLLLLASSIALFSQVDAWPGGLVGVLELLYRVMLVAFYFLAVVLLLIRTDAKAKSDRLLPRAAAYAGSFAPFLLAFTEGGSVSTAQSIVAVSLQALGLGFTVYSLAVLRRSFGVEPQVRTLVRSGPYRWIRHPLYVGEIVILVGAVLMGPSWERFAVLVFSAALQVYRAIHEERLLAAHIPEYTSYMQEAKRFEPRLI